MPDLTATSEESDFDAQRERDLAEQDTDGSSSEDKRTVVQALREVAVQKGGLAYQPCKAPLLDLVAAHDL